ncbi:MAG: YceI family protein [Deltaproteobacteria bacterium]|nr:YceI family protein [Deltaproteobacteria bacterium]
MKILAGLSLAAVLALFPSTSSEAAPADVPVPARFLGACDISFLATATLHDVSGSARCQPFTVRIARDAPGKEVIPVVEVEVPVAAMDTRNKSRDGQMREMFRSDRFPRIRGTAHDVDVERLREEMGKGRAGKAPLDLLLRIRDVERKVRATASNLKESGERVTFDLDFPVSLGEFDLKAPSLLGIIRVGDKVTVKATFTLTVPRSP